MERKNGLKPEGEELIIRSQGYLKAPESFRRSYDLKNSKNPVNTFSQEDKKTGNVRLVFEWRKEDLKTRS